MTNWEYILSIHNYWYLKRSPLNIENNFDIIECVAYENVMSKVKL